ncbi:transposase [Enterovibrio sp. ZSDZ42]|uniref:Transposase n=1 Tax=Enterovibrio gelatinilyticus TaxID=2899819 RepID=A0ABT5R484_9GAMM|nr:transposase [Enterovibrio sp. ZSDZ42]MDD1794804.1 transposase [Enterovibrio sp. ZSDZ42]
MRFYNQQHNYYCGIDLHAHILYVCILDATGKLVRHGAHLKTHVSNTFTQYNVPSPNLALRYPSSREDVRNRFNEPAINRNIDIALNMIGFYTKELPHVECFIEKNAKQHNPRDYLLLQTVPGIGRILALTILYEIGNIQRFPFVQHFASIPTW